MYKTKFSRHTLAFLVIAVASALLYPVAQASLTPLAWALIAVIVAANILTLFTS
jgi:hypothetical protein